MKFLKYTIFFLLLSLNIEAQNTPEYLNFTESRNKLAFNIFNSLNNKEQNVIFSPYFLNFSFSEIYLATNGNTSAQVRDYAHFLKDKETHKKNMSLFQSIIKNNDNKKINFKYSINIFINDSTKILKKFQQTLDSFLTDTVRHVSFYKDSTKAIAYINKIIEKNTLEYIKNPLKKELFAQKTSLIACSAAFFSGHLANNFHNFILAPFFQDSLKKSLKKIKYLTTNDYFKYSESADYQIIELPYDSYKFSLLIILPKKDSSLEKLNYYFNYNSFLMWQRNILQTERVRVLIPEISIEKNYNIKTRIKNITPFIFIKGGNFLNMVKKVVFISDFYHYAKFKLESSYKPETQIKNIDFDKETQKNESYIFNANHPFLFLLIDKKTQTILFIGKFTSP